MRIQRLMTRAVWTCRPTDGLDVAVRIMRDRDCGSVVVTDEHDRAVAVVTDRDVSIRALESGAALADLRVSDAMSGELYTCRPDESVTEAEARMVRHQVRRLPVVDLRGCLVGIVSIDDIAREAARVVASHAEPVTGDEVGRTLGGLARPRIPKPTTS